MSSYASVARGKKYTVENEEEKDKMSVTDAITPRASIIALQATKTSKVENSSDNKLMAPIPERGRPARVLESPPNRPMTSESSAADVFEPALSDWSATTAQARTSKSTSPVGRGIAQPKSPMIVHATSAPPHDKDPKPVLLTPTWQPTSSGISKPLNPAPEKETASKLTLFQQWIKFSNLLQGRDKTYRLIQYFTKFVIYFATEWKFEKTVVQRMNKLASACSATRKLLRAGKTLDHLQTFQQTLKAPVDDIARITQLGKSAGYGIWLLYDFCQWLNATGVRPFTAPTMKSINQKAAQWWFYALVWSLFNTLHQLQKYYMYNDIYKKIVYQHQIHDKPLSKETVKMGQNLSKDRQKLWRDVVQISCDMIIPASSLGWITQNGAVPGFAGTISSLLGIYAIWPSS